MAEYSLGAILAISITLGVLALVAIIALAIAATLAIRQRASVYTEQSKPPLQSLRAFSMFGSKASKAAPNQPEVKPEFKRILEVTPPDSRSGIKADQLSKSVAQATSTPIALESVELQPAMPAKAGIGSISSKHPWPLQKNTSETNDTAGPNVTLGSPAMLQLKHGGTRRLLRPKSANSSNSESVNGVAELFRKYQELKNQHNPEGNYTDPGHILRVQSPATLKAGPNARSQLKNGEHVQANSGSLETASLTDISLAQTPPLTIKNSNLDDAENDAIEKEKQTAARCPGEPSQSTSMPLHQSAKKTRIPQLEVKSPKYTQVIGTPPPPLLPLPVTPFKNHARSHSEPVTKVVTPLRSKGRLTTHSAQSTPLQVYKKVLPRKASSDSLSRNLSQLVTTWERKPSRSSRGSSLMASMNLSVMVAREQSPSPDSIKHPSSKPNISPQGPQSPLPKLAAHSGNLTPHTRSQLLRTPSLRFPRILMHHQYLSPATTSNTKGNAKEDTVTKTNETLPLSESRLPQTKREPGSNPSKQPANNTLIKGDIASHTSTFPKKYIQKKYSLKRSQLAKPLPTVPGGSGSGKSNGQMDKSMHQQHLELRTFSPFIVRLPGGSTTPDDKNSPQSAKSPSHNDKSKSVKHMNHHRTPSQLSDSPSGIVINLEGAIHRAEWMYSPRIEDELKLVEGDELEVYQVFDDGWCFARKCHDHKQSGICPMSALARLEDTGTDIDTAKS